MKSVHLSVMTGKESGIYYVCVYSTLSISLSSHKSSNQIQYLSRVGQHSQGKRKKEYSNKTCSKKIFTWLLVPDTMTDDNYQAEKR